VVAVVAITWVCVDCICIDVEVEEEEEGSGADARSLPCEEPPVAATAAGVVALMLSREGLPQIVTVSWHCPPRAVIFPATMGKPTTAAKDKQLFKHEECHWKSREAKNVIRINTATFHKHD